MANTTKEKKGLVAAKAEKPLKPALKQKRRKTVQYDNWGYFFIAPFFIVYLVFSLIPLCTTFFYSFFEYYRDGLSEVGPNFIMFKNYISIFAANDNIGKYFLNTVIMWLLGFIPQIVISLLLAVWFTNTELKLKCQQFFKTVIYMPNLIMAAAFAMLFFSLLSPSGPVNSIITSFVNKMNVPDVTKEIAATVDGLTKYAAENTVNSPLQTVINNLIATLNSVEVPKGITLDQANSLIASTKDTAIDLVRSTYNGNDWLNICSVIQNGLAAGPNAAEPIRFFNYTSWSRIIVATMNFLMWYGNTTILLMAGVMGIDNSLFEAARIDGASPLKIFFKITIPLLLPIFVYVLITSLIGGIQMFDVPQILTKGEGGPDRTTMTIIMKLNKHLYSKNYGLAGSTSVLVFAVTAVLSGFVYKFTMSKYTNKR